MKADVASSEATNRESVGPPANGGLFVFCVCHRCYPGRLDDEKDAALEAVFLGFARMTIWTVDPKTVTTRSKEVLP